MKIDSEELLDDLISRTYANIDSAKALNSLSEEKLNMKKEAGSWSILECLEHLNLYGDFYIPEIRSRIQQSSVKAEAQFKSGLLGNYFAKSMLPKDKLNKMKTFKDKNPAGSDLNKTTIQRFLDQQKELLTLLETAKTKNLNKVKTGISISKLIKLKLGDTFRVVIYHNDRHLVQAKRVLE